MTTSRIVPWDANQAWRTRARSRQVGLRRERTPVTPRPAQRPRRGGRGTRALIPLFLSSRRTTRAAKAAQRAPRKTVGRSLHMLAVLYLLLERTGCWPRACVTQTFAYSRLSSFTLSQPEVHRDLTAYESRANLFCWHAGRWSAAVAHREPSGPTRSLVMNRIDVRGGTRRTELALLTTRSYLGQHHGRSPNERCPGTRWRADSKLLRPGPPQTNTHVGRGGVKCSRHMNRKTA
jgi:hypothetical protein